MKKQKHLALLFLMILSISVYLNSIYGEFVMDDEMLIKNYQAIRSFSMDLLTYRLLRTFSYAVDYFFWELNPLGYHLSNMIYNTLTVIVVFLLTRRLVGNLFVPLLTALFFAVHPIHTEAVSYLSGRRDLLSALFYLSGFLSYLKGRQEERNVFYFLTLLCFIGGILSKEIAVTLPIMIFSYELILWIANRKCEDRSIFRLLSAGIAETVRRFKWIILATFSFVASYLYVLLYIQGASQFVNSGQIRWWGGDIVSNFSTVGRMVVYYLYKLFFPIILLVDYRQFPYSQTFLDHRFLLAVSVIAGVLTLSLACLRKNHLMTFAIWWFFISLLPVMHIIPHHILMAEHYLYLPSYGFCLAMSLGLYQIFQKERLKIPVLIIAFILLVLYSVRTVDRNQDWQDTLMLTREGVWHQPENPFYHYYLGRAYAQNKLFQSANRELAQAVGPRHDFSELRAIKALVSFQQGDYEQGVVETQEALMRNPDKQMALNNMGFFAMKMGDYKTALENYLKVDPEYKSGIALDKISLIYMEQGDLKKAEDMLRRLLQLQPEHRKAHLTLAEVYTKLLRFEEAIGQYDNLLESIEDPDGESSGNDKIMDGNLIESKITYLEEMKEKYRTALDNLSHGDLATGHQLLGAIHFDILNLEKAEKELEKALTAGGDSTPIYPLLGKIYQLTNRFQEAERIYNRLFSAGQDLSPNVLAEAGEFFARSLKFKKAEELFEHALEKGPDDQKIRDFLKWSILLQKEYEDAKRLQGAGQDEEAALKMAEIHLSLGEKQKALFVLEQALEKEPAEEMLLKSLASIYETLGYPFWEKTIQTYKTLISLNTGDADAYRRLALFYYQTIEDYESALFYLQQSLSVNPHQEGAEEMEQMVKTLNHYIKLYKAG